MIRWAIQPRGHDEPIGTVGLLYVNHEHCRGSSAMTWRGAGGKGAYDRESRGCHGSAPEPGLRPVSGQLCVSNRTSRAYAGQYGKAIDRPVDLVRRRVGRGGLRACLRV